MSKTPGLGRRVGWAFMGLIRSSRASVSHSGKGAQFPAVLFGPAGSLSPWVMDESSSQSDPAGTFKETGQAWFRTAVPDGDLRLIEEWVEVARKPGQRIVGPMPGPAMDTLEGLVRRLLPKSRLVRAVAFNKAGETNWAVPWHQDRVIAVTARHDIDGFTNWTCKDGIWHCEPPVSILQQMLFARLHLDPAGLENGCMEIAPGSHRLGLIAAGDANDVAAGLGSQPCIAARGDLQVLNMLTLHRSRPATNPRPRRAIRLDFAAAALPEPLEWWSTDRC